MGRWMMVGLVAVLAAALLPRPALAESGDLVWTRAFGTRRDDGVDAIAAHAGGAYVVGHIRTRAAEGDIGGPHAYVRSYAADGALRWARTFRLRNGWTGDASTVASAVAVDGTGVYVAGGLGRAGGDSVWDGYVRKYTHRGGHLWTRFIGGRTSPESGGSSEFVAGIAVDGTGVYVGGDVLVEPPGRHSAAYRDMFLRKYATDGRIVWTRQARTACEESASGVALDAWGVLVVGTTYGACPGQAHVDADGINAFVARYGRSGGLYWTRHFGTDEADFAHAIAADRTGFYVGGDTSGRFPGQAGRGGEDAWVRKYRADGAPLWTRQFGTGRGDGVFGLDADGGRVYLTGYTEGGFAGAANRGEWDVYVTSFTGAGVRGWTRQFGSGRTDQGEGIALGPPPSDTQQGGSRGLYVTGSVYGALCCGDAFLRKYEE